MLLRKLIREQIATYFESSEWTEALEAMKRGRMDVLHAHIYVESVLHPHSIRDVVEAYFRAKSIKMERKIKFLSHGKGYGNVYYIQPEGMCHFEVFPKFNPDVVIEPMSSKNSRGGKSFEYWDRDFMQEYYKRFHFRSFGNEEATAVANYFQSDAWKAIYGVMYLDNERSVHSHAVVETSLHPEDILPLGTAALTALGWDVDRAVSIVFNVNGHNQGKITYLVRRPEIVLELEWLPNKSEIIKPAILPVARITTTDMVERDMEGIPYITLGSDDIDWLTERFAGGRAS